MLHLAIRTLALFTTLLFAAHTTAGVPPDGAPSQAVRLTPDAGRGKYIFDTLCSQCHGENGWGSYDGEFPQIAGQHSSVIIKQLTDIRSGKRDNPRMLPIVQREVLGGDQALADVAAYIASLPMNPYPEIGVAEETDLEHAKQMYLQMCAECHGKQGEGDAAQRYPLIQGQHYEYLLRQLRWIRDNKRKNANRQMAELIQPLSDEQLALFADYISRQMPPQEKLADE